MNNTGKKNTKVTFTDDEKKLIFGILHATWNYIGYDYLEAGGGRDIPKSQVIESVLDADYAAEHVRTPEQKAAWAKYKSTGYPAMVKLAKETFKFARYGY